jgi:hypothetical protein
MSDEYQQIKNIFDFIKDNFTILTEKEKTETSIKALIRNSILERALAKFFFQYRSKEYDLYNLLAYFKENSDNPESDNIFPYIKEQFISLSKTEFRIAPLIFYSKYLLPYID